MDWEAIIVAVLAVVGSYAGNVAITHRKAQEDAIKDAAREQQQMDKLKEIEKKLDEHNGYAQKFGEIQKDIAAIKSDNASIKTSIKYLEKEVGK